MNDHTTTGHPANKWRTELSKNQMFRVVNIVENYTTSTKRFVCFYSRKTYDMTVNMVYSK